MTNVLNPPRKIWTRAEYELLDKSGILAGEHIELVQGDLISRRGKTPPQVFAHHLLTNWLREVFGFAQFLVRDAFPV